MEIIRENNIREMYRSPFIPYVFWVLTNDLDSYFTNLLLNETTGNIKLRDLLEVELVKNELKKEGWQKFTLPLARIIQPDGSFTEI